jgi:ribonuclease HII
MLLGIDEAGRGPVIGPLTLCGVWVTDHGARKLRELGIRDSKAFGSSDRARKERARLATEVRRVATHVTLLCVDAAEVDRRVRLGELNLLEQELAEAVILDGPEATRIVADGERLFSPLTARYPQLRARNKADSTSPAVAAASIVAKHERDRLFAEIAARYEPEFGPLGGGGYINPATETFLLAYFDRYRELPVEVRRSWSWQLIKDLERVMAGKKPWRPPEQLDLLGK